MQRLYLQSSHLLLFFFQAEDGIRDGHVTGVQTCALPILEGTAAPNANVVIDGGAASGPADSSGGFRIQKDGFASPTCVIKIGRASCRERVEISGIAGAMEREGEAHR